MRNSNPHNIPTRPLDRAKIRAVAEAERLIDAQIVEVDLDQGLICDNPGHCIVGGLLFAAGVSNKRLAKLPSSPWSFPLSMLELLYTTYGINVYDLDSLVGRNDMFGGNSPVSITLRRERVLEAVDDLKDESPFYAPSAAERRTGCPI